MFFKFKSYAFPLHFCFLECLYYMIMFCEYPTAVEDKINIIIVLLICPVLSLLFYNRTAHYFT